MKIAAEYINVNCPEADIYNQLLNLDNTHILELGCGSAKITRDIASTGVARKITALEVDEVAHAKNLQITDLPNVTFQLSGAQSIPLADESVDVVFMFKSLHHVPLALMDEAMQEIHRVLKPTGFAYISEPIFDGDFNEILRLFHDEKIVREAAFNTVKKVVETGLFKLAGQTFFNAPMQFIDFSEFETNIIKVTHSNHTLDDALLSKVKARFETYVDETGASFQMPIRVDLLQK